MKTTAVGKGWVRGTSLLLYFLLGSMITSCGGGKFDATGKEIDFQSEHPPIQAALGVTPVSSSVGQSTPQPPTRAGVLNVNAQTSDLAYKFMLPDSWAFASKSVHPWELQGAGDFNRDGVNDIVVVDNMWGLGGKRSLLVNGMSGGWPARLTARSTTDEVPENLSPILELPFFVDSILGDMNGDGKQELVIGTRSYHDDNLHTYILFDANNATNAFDGRVDPSVNAEDVVVLRSSGRVIRHVYDVGDTNGDGFDDAALIFETTEDIHRGVDGMLVLGRAADYPATIELDHPLEYAIPLKFENPDNRSLIVEKMGDINGDGMDDFTFAFSHHGLQPPPVNIALIMGRVWDSSLALTISENPGSDFPVMSGLNPPQSPDYCCSATDPASQQFTSVGDFNNDGFDDVALAYSRESQSIMLLAGNSSVGQADYNWLEHPTTVNLAMHTSLSSLADKYTGQKSLSAAGDVDGDGADDIVVSHQSGLGWYDWNKGEAVIVYGVDTMLSEQPLSEGMPAEEILADTTLLSDANDGIAALGDVDGDQVADLAIGVSHYRDEGRLGGIEKQLGDSGDVYISIPPYEVGERAPYYDNGDIKNLWMQVLPSPGLLDENVAEALTLDVNEVPVVLTQEFLDPLLIKFNAAVNGELTQKNPLGWSVQNVLETSDADGSRVIKSARLYHAGDSGDGYRPATVDGTIVDIEPGISLFIHAVFGFGSVGAYNERGFRCSVDLTDNTIVAEVHDCRDALTLAAERLSLWQ